VLQDIDLRELAEMEGPERGFVSACLTGREGLRTVEARADRIRAMLEDNSDAVADNTDTRIYLMAAENTELEDQVWGNIKNRVKKGGWSRKRYARRRKNELHHYAVEVAEVLEDLDRKESIDHIILMGSRDTMQEIEDALSEQMADKVIGEKSADLDAGTDELVDDAYDVFFKEEREEDRHLWERIRGEYLADHPASVGSEDVLMALLNGRV
jgi:peptide subunit release factor 1 (eRF1)